MAPLRPPKDDVSFGITTDGSDNLTITGCLERTPKVMGNLSNDPGPNKILLLSHDASGAPRWIKTFAGIGSDGGRGIATDAAGNLFVAGIFDDQVDFGAELLVTDGKSDGFLLMFSP